MGDIAIKVDGLSKRYHIGALKITYKTVRESLANAVTNLFRCSNSQSDIIWALKDVSFEVKHGEVIGIIGRNGAGKTTLLKILSRITEPSEGYAEIHGRVGSLLEVGTGFHPELTGRENIYLNGAILGMKKREIERNFDEIVNFAEVEKFLDTPMKRYSSGMQVRLAFAIAAHLEPEILLVDEVLAVGDISFQKKCLGKMGSLSQEGRTLIFVSHNIQAVLRLTRKAILLNKGNLITVGPTFEVVEQFQNSINTSALNGAVELESVKRTSGDQKIMLTKVSLINSKGGVANSFIAGEAVTVRLEFISHICSEEFEIGYGIRTLEGVILFVSSSSDEGNLITIDKGHYQIESTIQPNYLKPGRYWVSVGITCGMLRDFIEEAVSFEITTSGSLSQSPLLHLPGYFYFINQWTNPVKSDGI